MSVRIAVLPVAGLGTRFLPATRAIPKELLPIVDRPVIHYAMEEARDAGIEQFLFVTARGKTVIEDHFDRHPALERFLQDRNNQEALQALLADSPAPGSIAYIRQGMPKGLGHAISCVRSAVGSEPFAVLLPDDFFCSEQPALTSLIRTHESLPGGGHVVGVQEVANFETSRYGIITPDGGSMESDVARVLDLVEKPEPEDAPSKYAVMGRYILEPDIFQYLSNASEGVGGEIQLTDALANAAADGIVHAVKIPGVRFDCGSRIGLLKANIIHALERDGIGAELRTFLRKLAI